VSLHDKKKTREKLQKRVTLSRFWYTLKNLDLKTILEIFLNLGFEIKNLLNELGNERPILGSHKHLHQIC
jgi:hypothetical protein